jgi:Leucine-rich repeat (LRR) protein
MLPQDQIKYKQFNDHALEFMDLKHITILDDEPKLKSDSNLNTLFFKDVSFKGFPKQFCDFTNIESISIFGCDSTISVLLKNLRVFKKLKYLFISDCNVKIFPNEFFDCDSLAELKFQRCNIPAIDYRFSKLSNLEEYAFYSTKNIDFDSILSMKKLKILTLYDADDNFVPKFLPNCPIFEEYSYNTRLDNIDEVIEVLSKCKHLISLSFSHTGYKSIPKSITKLRNLEYFEFSSDSLSEIPDFISELNTLISINLAKNQISDISVLSRLKRLSSIELAHNRILAIPDSFYLFRKVFVMNLSFNNLKHFPFDKLKDIWATNLDNPIEINLASNFIDSIPSFSDTLDREFVVKFSRNKGKLKEPSKHIVGHNPEYCPDNFIFEMPKGIFNLKIKGSLYFDNISIPKIDADKIEEHFKNLGGRAVFSYGMMY